ncbi:MAG: hypothetical protein R6V00_11435 [Candidatus Aminicenantes bacterium]
MKDYLLRNIMTMGLRLMERGKDVVQTQYQKLSQNIPEVKEIIN